MHLPLIRQRVQFHWYAMNAAAATAAKRDDPLFMLHNAIPVAKRTYFQTVRIKTK